MELLQLKYFKEAAKTQNFSKVAEKYFVAQPAVSHTISKLESELGVKLFTRSGNRVILNDFGLAFYEDVDAAIESVSSKFSDCFCEVRPHAKFPVFTFKVSCALKVYFEAPII